MNSPEHGILIERAVFPERLFAYRHIMPSEGIAARGRWGSSVFATPTLQCWCSEIERSAYCHVDARHRNEERKRTVPDAFREPGLAKPSDLCETARQQKAGDFVPMSTRVFEILRNTCDARPEGWVFPSRALRFRAPPHRSHYGRKLAGSHQNSRAIVVSCTVANQFFRKARVVARFSEEIANRPRSLSR